MFFPLWLLWQLIFTKCPFLMSWKDFVIHCILPVETQRNRNVTSWLRDRACARTGLSYLAGHYFILSGCLPVSIPMILTSLPQSPGFFSPIVTGPQETEAARISCNHRPALNHNCVNLITSGVLSLHLGHKVAPRPHTFLLISGWRCVTEGVGSNNRVELLVFPWIPSGGQQTIAQELGGCGEVGNQVMQSQPGGPLSLSTNKPAPL